MTAVDRLEASLRDLESPGRPFAAEALASLDAAEAFPERACRALDGLGLHHHYVPAGYGGRLTDLAELMSLVRVVARRDLTVAVAHAKTFLGVASVWVAGSDEQCARVAGRVLAGAPVAWALTEPAHGSDLLAGEVTATGQGDSWRLDGTKWPINNATRGELACVLARTSPAGGPRGFDVFLVDKRDLAPGSVRHLPKAKTHGIRGADISGIAFDGAVVPSAARVGRHGAGLETTLKALQLTRTVCVGLSLGAGDHASRLVLAFLRERRVFGRVLGDLPRIRRLLGEALTGLRLAEVTALACARGAHALTSELSVGSAIAKALVPSLVQRSIERLAELLGARALLTGTYACGMFAKLERDHRIVGLFDGSTAVNRHSLITQFPRLARGLGAGETAGLDVALTRSAPVADLEPRRLSLFSADGCSVVRGLPAAIDRVAVMAAEGEATPALLGLVQELGKIAVDLHEALAACGPAGTGAAPSHFALAERYELCFAAAAALGMWLRDVPPRDEQSLRACLALVLDRLEPAGGARDPRLFDNVAEAALERA
ncbi:acyl-CoA dehydrogenase family protein [Actinomadura sp. NTSP31]|uniref:acyl-CoA dehydrogenase family protein n=1 Tax=Actinomadura sp. NTSP31 TaxID=1735447 RepID=UPI0035C18B56